MTSPQEQEPRLSNGRPGILLSEAWEEGGAARDAKTHRNIQAWEDHADACDLRGAGYAAEASAFPVSHRDHHYYLRLANEQCRKAAEARRWAEIERNSL